MTFWKQSALTLAAGLVMASPVIAANTMAGPLDAGDLPNLLRWFLLAISVVGTVVFGLGMLRLWTVFAFHMLLPLKLFDRSENFRDWQAACEEVPFMRWLLAIDEFAKDRRSNA